MNEVAGNAASYLPRLSSPAQIESWSARGAVALRELLSESAPAKARRKELGQEWIKRFDANRAIDGYLSVYKAVSEITLTQRAAEPGLDRSTQISERGGR
jgi:hypothetical protein